MLLRGFCLECNSVSLFFCCLPKFSQLPYHESGEGEFLAGYGPAAAFEFVVEVGKAANDAAKERLAPATATFGGISLFAEHKVVFAESLGCFFGAHVLFACQ